MFMFLCVNEMVSCSFVNRQPSSDNRPRFGDVDGSQRGRSRTKQHRHHDDAAYVSPRTAPLHMSSSAERDCRPYAAAPGAYPFPDTPTFAPTFEQRRSRSMHAARNSDGFHCPACTRHYSDYRCVKRHAVLKHYQDYDQHKGVLVSFGSQEELDRAYGTYKRSQESRKSTSSSISRGRPAFRGRRRLFRGGMSGDLPRRGGNLAYGMGGRRGYVNAPENSGTAAVCGRYTDTQLPNDNDNTDTGRPMSVDKAPVTHSSDFGARPVSPGSGCHEFHCTRELPQSNEARSSSPDSVCSVPCRDEPKSACSSHEVSCSHMSSASLVVSAENCSGVFTGDNNSVYVGANESCARTRPKDGGERTHDVRGRKRMATDSDVHVVDGNNFPRTLTECVERRSSKNAPEGIDKLLRGKMLNPANSDVKNDHNGNVVNCRVPVTDVMMTSVCKEPISIGGVTERSTQFVFTTEYPEDGQFDDVCELVGDDSAVPQHLAYIVACMPSAMTDETNTLLQQEMGPPYLSGTEMLTGLSDCYADSMTPLTVQCDTPLTVLSGTDVRNVFDDIRKICTNNDAVLDVAGDAVAGIVDVDEFLNTAMSKSPTDDVNAKEMLTSGERAVSSDVVACVNKSISVQYTPDQIKQMAAGVKRSLDFSVNEKLSVLAEMGELHKYETKCSAGADLNQDSGMHADVRASILDDKSQQSSAISSSEDVAVNAKSCAETELLSRTDDVAAKPQRLEREADKCKCGKSRRTLRSRYTQTTRTQVARPTRTQTVQVDVQTRSVRVQADPRAKLVNFGLPSGLALSKVINKSRIRGLNLKDLVSSLEQDFRIQWQRGFSADERANVLAMVYVAAAVRRDAADEIMQYESTFYLEGGRIPGNEATADKNILSILSSARNWALETRCRDTCFTDEGDDSLTPNAADFATDYETRNSDTTLSVDYDSSASAAAGAMTAYRLQVGQDWDDDDDDPVIYSMPDGNIGVLFHEENGEVICHEVLLDTVNGR